MEFLADNNVENMLRLLLGIVSLAGLLWGAIRYMVKYTVERSEERSRTRILQARNEARAEAAVAKRTAENVEYRLEAHIRNEHPKLEARIRVLEGRSGMRK